MKQTLAIAATITGALLATSNAGAQGPVTVTECPKGHKQAEVDIAVQLVTAAGCPVLEDEKLRELIFENFHGTSFAGFPGTCISGQIVGGTISFEGKAPVPVTGTTESAQRLMPEAAALDNPLPSPPGFPPPPAALFLNGLASSVPFFSGAAATVVSLESEDNRLDGLKLVLEDRFTVNAATGADTEDFLVVGSDKRSVTGRLVGRGITDGMGGFPVPLSVQGSLCIK